jgi:hypothetical protein
VIRGAGQKATDGLVTSGFKEYELAQRLYDISAIAPLEIGFVFNGEEAYLRLVFT